MEYILPFNKNKWALLIEPTFQQYKSEKSLNNNFVVKVDYKSIEIPFGVRYYSFLNQKSKIFINAAYVFDFAYNSKIYYNSIGTSAKITKTIHFAFGFGYNFNSKFNIELRHSLDRSIFLHNSFWHSNYKSSSLIIGYTIF